MIQEIAPSTFHNRFTSLSPLPESAVLCFREGALLTAYDEKEKRLLFPRAKEFSGTLHAVYAFSIDEQRFFLAMDTADAPAGYRFFSVRELRALPLCLNADLFAVYSGYHLFTWYASSRYCGACGAQMETDRTERAMFCPRCQTKTYPRINPAVIVGVVHGDQLLLTKYRTGFAHNALVAGFTEFGETLEETAAREVMEEVGLRVKNIRYYKSQPCAVAADILAGFFCQVDGDPTIRMDGNELKFARWVRREDIILQPNDYSLTNEMMRLFRDGKWNERMFGGEESGEWRAKS